MVHWKVSALLIAVGLTVISACTASSGPTTDQPPGSTSPPFGHIHGVDINPADGRVYAATHHGVFRLDDQGPALVSERLQDTMGFTIVGPDRFLGSGHPGSGESGPTHLGLIVSSDGGRTWAPVALTDQADFHALSAAGVTVYGFNGLTASVMRSDDGGRHWQQGASHEMTDLDVDPQNPMHVVSTTTRDGLRESLDGGMTFTPLIPQPPRPLALVDHIPYAGGSDREPVIAGVDATGAVMSLGTAGWQVAGSLPGTPTAFTVIAPDSYLAATGTQVFGSEDSGRSWAALTTATR